MQVSRQKLTDVAIEMLNHITIFIEGTEANVRQVLVDLNPSVSGPDYDFANHFVPVDKDEDGVPMIGAPLYRQSNIPSGPIDEKYAQVFSAAYPDVNIVAIPFAKGGTTYRAGKSVAHIR